MVSIAKENPFCELWLAHTWRRPQVEQAFFDRLARNFDLVEASREGEASIFTGKFKLQSTTQDDSLEDSDDISSLLERIRLLESDLSSIKPCEDE